MHARAIRASRHFGPTFLTGILRPLSNDVQPRVACWSSGMILALVLEVPGSVPRHAFFNTLLSMNTTSYRNRQFYDGFCDVTTAI